MESPVPFAIPAWVSSRLFAVGGNLSLPIESTGRMAHGTGRLVVTNDLSLVVLRVLASSRETNRLPYLIERANRRRQLPRFVAM
ncbi:MAG: hypothetical protein ACK5ZC_06615 [Pirellulaceae bacterium]